MRVHLEAGRQRDRLGDGLCHGCRHRCDRLSRRSVEFGRQRARFIRVGHANRDGHDQHAEATEPDPPARGGCAGHNRRA